jgi:hypothetical protein
MGEFLRMSPVQHSEMKLRSPAGAKAGPSNKNGLRNGVSAVPPVDPQIVFNDLALIDANAKLLMLLVSPDGIEPSTY